MRWVMELELDNDAALDRVLKRVISDPKVSDIRVDGLSNDELKARILALADADLEAERKAKTIPF